MKLFTDKRMQPTRKILAYSVQTALAFIFISTVGLLTDFPTPLLILAYVVWAACTGVAIVPETPNEVREFKEYLDRKYPWV